MTNEKTTPKEYSVSAAELLREIPKLSERGITEFYVHDDAVARDKKTLLSVLNKASETEDIFFTVRAYASALDRDVVSAAQNVNCSLEIALEGTVKGGDGARDAKQGARSGRDTRDAKQGARSGHDTCNAKQGPALLFDKKLYSSKARLLNEAELVFGFDMAWALQKGDTFKAFRDRLDFAVSLYPNHIEFAQFAGGEEEIFPAPTGVFSSKDIDFARGMAFACRTFYTAGRAVPWFNAVLSALRIMPSAFFADFDEWQQCNNCSMDTGFVPEDVPHSEIEKMQLKFLEQKFLEKHKGELYTAVSDLVRLHGAFSRLAEEGEECVLETNYNPDDILSPYAMNLASFTENVTMESCSVRVFNNGGMPDYKIL